MDIGRPAEEESSFFNLTSFKILIIFYIVELIIQFSFLKKEAR